MDHLRKDVLSKLISFSDELVFIKKELKKFEWDSEEELVTITRDSMKKILNRVKSKNISIENLEEWGSLVECREDIGYEEKSFDVIKEIISCLANPDLYGNCSIEKINDWLNVLVKE